MGFPYKAPPMEHQRRALKKAWKKKDFALFWEMGTGKTFTAINLAAGRYNQDKIDALLIICPTPIKLVWESELENWCPVDYKVQVLVAGRESQKQAKIFAKEKLDALKVLVVGIEALSQGKAWEVAKEFAVLNTTMMVADESSRLKNHKANRTKRAITIADHCAYRMILTGTPITQGVEDLFGQFQFLNPGILGTNSFVIFRRRYCVTRKIKIGEKIINGKLRQITVPKITGYIRLNDLFDRVRPYADVVKKEDVLDLPPKVYQRVVVEPTDEQLYLIDELKESFEVEHGGEILMAETILERLTRFQQIIGGHFPFNLEDGGFDVKPIEGKNPKLDALLEILDEIGDDTKVIIWTRFKPESRLIKSSISTQFGEEAIASFTGDDDEDSRKDAVKRFMHGNARFMISSPQLGGMGQTWTAATLVIYYSNSFSYEDRKQSEDRAHRKGQNESVTYIDIEANHHYDQIILKAIKTKQDVASMVDKNLAPDVAISLDEALP
jgi:SNF2 family DNA or RNA helicase